MILGCAILSLLYIFLLYPHIVMEGASNGLLLWANRVLPLLLPCMILTQLCIHSGCLEIFMDRSKFLQGKQHHFSGYGLYTAILGLLCGFPMGAKLIHDFYLDKKIEKQEAFELLTFCSQVSPAFLFGYVYTDLLYEKSYKLLLLLSYYMALLLIWRIGHCIFHKHFENVFPVSSNSTSIAACSINPQEDNAPLTFAQKLDLSINNSLTTLIRVGGYIVLFSVLAALIMRLPYIPAQIKAFCVSIVEITTGLDVFSNINMPLLYKAALTNMFCAFGGISSMMQVSGELNGTDFPILWYFIIKSGQAMLTGLITCLFLFFVL